MSGIELKYDRSRNDEIVATLPTSKSMAARALVIGALAGIRPEEIPDLPVCTDTKELSAAINELLAALEKKDNALEKKDNEESLPESPVCLNLNLGLGGTSLRFFTALAASIPEAEFEIDCAAPLKKRPLAPLCEALITAGADIKYLDTPGYPPLLIKGKHIPGGERGIAAGISSQFISAMIMCAPYWRDGLRLSLTGEEAVSFPYIDMTVKMMRKAGAKVDVTNGNRLICVDADPYSLKDPRQLRPEADWSAASYFYELALALPDRKIRLASLTPPDESLQGDSRCAEIFSFLGVNTEFLPDGSAILSCDRKIRDGVAEASKKLPLELDMSATPDLVPALAVALCLAGIRYRISGIAHLHIKESDRIAALQLELEKIGYGLQAGADFLSWDGSRMPVGESEAIETYHDHRIAMAFAIAATALPYLSIRNPEVTEKSFPDYFDILKEAGFEGIRF